MFEGGWPYPPYSLTARLSYPSSRHHFEQFGVLISAITIGIAWAADALLHNILECLPAFRKQGSISGHCFVPPKDDIAIGGVIFDQTGSASRLLCSDQCRAEATKRIEHDIAPTAAVLDRIGNKSDRLDLAKDSLDNRDPLCSIAFPDCNQSIRLLNRQSLDPIFKSNARPAVNFGAD